MTYVLLAAALTIPGLAHGNGGLTIQDPEDASLPSTIDIRSLTLTNDAQNLYVVLAFRDLSNPDPSAAGSYQVVYLFEWMYRGDVYSVRTEVLGYESTHRGLGYGPMVFVPGVGVLAGELITSSGTVVYGSDDDGHYFHNDGIEATFNLAESTLTLTIPLIMTITPSRGSDEVITAIAQVGEKIQLNRVISGTPGVVRTDTMPVSSTSYTLK